MLTHNAKNERIKHRYFGWLKGARGHSDASLATIAKALSRFEVFGGRRDFGTFRFEQAESFKRYLFAQTNARTKELLSKATIHSTLCALNSFFIWLTQELGYRSKIKYHDVEYFRVSMKDARIATFRRMPRFPTPAQIVLALMTMPVGTEIERRDQAFFAFVFLTAARDGAAASMRLGDIDLDIGCVHHDARHVRTKFSKSFIGGFFPVDERARAIVVAWVTWLRVEKHFDSTGPAFPATATGMGPDKRLGPQGLSRTSWKTTGPARKIFREAFARVGLPYFNPHSFRHTIAHIGQKLCRTDAERKAWSQNMGHDHIKTTSDCYGPMDTSRQLEIMKEFLDPEKAASCGEGPDIKQQVKSAMAEWYEENRTDGGFDRQFRVKQLIPTIHKT